MVWQGVNLSLSNRNEIGVKTGTFSSGGKGKFSYDSSKMRKWKNKYTNYCFSHLRDSLDMRFHMLKNGGENNGRNSIKIMKEYIWNHLKSARPFLPAISTLKLFDAFPLADRNNLLIVVVHKQCNKWWHIILSEGQWYCIAYLYFLVMRMQMPTKATVIPIPTTVGMMMWL